MERSRSNNPPTRLRSGIAALGVAMSFAIGTGTVHAAGTASGTSINNLSTLNYSVGGTAQPAIGSSPTGNTSGAGTATTFVVDNLVNVTVATTNAAFVQVAPGALAQVTTFTVTNTGNAVQDFALTSAQAATGQVQFGTDNADTGTCSQFVESNGAPNGYQVGVDVATFIDELAADTTRTVYVVCDIPVGAPQSAHSVVGLIATARAGGAVGLGGTLTNAGANTPGVDIVFGDAVGSDDGPTLPDAAHSARSAYRVVTSALTVTKVASLVCDPLTSVTNPKNIPGAIVRYTITVANAAGAASASLTSVTDAINTAVATFDPNLVTGAGGVAGCVSAAPGVPESAAGSGFKLDVINDTRPGTYPKYLTTANDADGVHFVSPNVTVNFAIAMPAEGTYAAGELKQNESVVVSFNVTIL